jgi:hypothetical protein
MRSLVIRIAYHGGRLWLAANLQQALQDRDSASQASMIRAGKLTFVAWLHAVWVATSEIAWVLTGRRPGWTVPR